MRQFSLRSMLIYVVAWCGYLAALSSMSATQPSQDLRSDVYVVLSLLVIWLLLMVVYASWRLKGVLIFHLLGLGVVVTFVLMYAANIDLPRGVDPVPFILRGFMFGCFLSTFFSFPLATLLLLLRAFRSKKRLKRIQGGQRSQGPPSTDRLE